MQLNRKLRISKEDYEKKNQNNFQIFFANECIPNRRCTMIFTKFIAIFNFYRLSSHLDSTLYILNHFVFSTFVFYILIFLLLLSL